MLKRRMKPVDVAKHFIDKNVDRKGLEKRFINNHIGEQLSHDYRLTILY